MKKILIIIFLLFAGVVGFYIGLTQRPIVVSVHQTGSATSTVVLTGGQVLSNPFGNNSGKPTSLPWYISRASALAAYLLMFAIIVWGMGLTTGFTYKITNPVKAWGIHKYMSISFGVLVLVHIISLLFDKYVSFGIGDILLPFVGNYKEPYLAFGVIGFYLLVIIIFSSLLVRIKYQAFWRVAHYLVYPLFVVSLIHGLFIGTDTQAVAVQTMYWITGIIFVFILFYRFVFYKASPE